MYRVRTTVSLRFLPEFDYKQSFVGDHYISKETVRAILSIVDSALLLLAKIQVVRLFQ